VRYDAAGRERFRRRHGLADKFVVMYSGNHSPCHSLGTILSAARRASHNDEIVFCFVGGGSEHGRVKEFASDNGLTNIICLPYQPVGDLSASLSAADLHVIVMGDAFVGIVHPCKIYNILQLGVPVLHIGPGQSHVADLLTECPEVRSYTHAHGDVDGVLNAIFDASRARNGETTTPAIACRFSQKAVLEQFRAVVEMDAQPEHSAQAAQAAGD
jgi:hypothetical protein